MEEEIITVIGIGNEFRSDDAAGLLTVRLLKENSSVEADFLEQSGEATTLMESMKQKAKVILVDAVQSGAEAGIIHRYNASEESMPAEFLRCSTHNFSVHDAIEMARALGQLPLQLIVYGIEGSNFDPGTELSPPVRVAVTKAEEQISRELQSLKERQTNA